MVSRRQSIITSNKWDPVEPFLVYVHGNRDEYLEAELKDDGTERFTRAVHDSLNTLGYEVELLYYVNMTTGKATLTAARENGKWLVLPGEMTPTEEDVRRGRENGAT